MTRVDLKIWAKNKIKENFWPLLGTIIVASMLTSLAYFSFDFSGTEPIVHYYSIGWIFYFVNVGLAYYMVRFVTGKKAVFSDIFAFVNDFLKCMLICLLQTLFVLLWTLLLVIPGIIKSLSYSLVPYLLADKQYKDMKIMDILRKSSEMMNGHKADLFILALSFIGWHLLAVLTLGILEIWIIPYQNTATAKFLNDVKTKYEENHKPIKLEKNSNKKTTKRGRTCPDCGARVSLSADFCSECGTAL